MAVALEPAQQAAIASLSIVIESWSGVCTADSPPNSDVLARACRSYLALVCAAMAPPALPREASEDDPLELGLDPASSAALSVVQADELVHEPTVLLARAPHRSRHVFALELQSAAARGQMAAEALLCKAPGIWFVPSGNAGVD